MGRAVAIFMCTVAMEFVVFKRIYRVKCMFGDAYELCLQMLGVIREAQFILYQSNDHDKQWKDSSVCED